MKKIIIASGLLLIGFVSFFYVYIPSTIKISSYKVSNAYELSVIKLLNDPQLLRNCLLKYQNPVNNELEFNGIRFKINAALSNVVNIEISSDNMHIPSYITASEHTKGTTAISWFLELKTTWNPIQRLLDYKNALKIKKASAQLLETINAFSENTKNIYGIDIKEVILKDTVLITTKFNSKEAPSNSEIYSAVNELENYLKQFGRKMLNNPMVSQFENQTNDYTIMVGISIDGVIPETDKFSIKKMPVNGKMFVSDIKGGKNRINEAYQSLKSFIMDTKRPSPAVPFELLINNRLQVKDSSLWETRIYYPIM